MRPNSISPSCGLLLLAVAVLVSAQDTVSPSSPPFPLDINGEAHFNIPVVVKLADGGNGAPAASAAVEARDENNAKVSLAPPAHIEPVFEVSHQGSNEHDNDAGNLQARNEAVMGTHTVLLVETTGTAISPVTEPCTDPTAPGHTNASAPNNATAPAAPVADETAGKLPPPLNHTGFPLRNSTGWAKPTAAAPGGIVAGTGAPYNNPANMAGAAGANNGTKGFMGAASAVAVSWSVGVVAAAAGIAAAAAF